MHDEGWHRLCDKYTRWGEVPDGTPHGWIQWKGTSVCMDFHCRCGELTHLDADFAYLIKCGKCGRVYWPKADVEMLELTGQDKEDAEASSPKVTTVSIIDDCAEEA